MSENVSIQESGKTRKFSGVGVIETETPEGDSCFWVPESERELETEYVIKNGTYRPKKYGFSDIHVNVFDLTTDLDGINWKIDIGDIDLPDISLPDFDIDLTIGTDGLPNIEFGIHIITIDEDEIKVVLPGGEEIIIHGPSLTEPVVILDAIEISYDPSTGEWTIKALVECTVGETTYNPGDVIKTWPGTEKVDFVIQYGIALPDLSETIDLDAGFDVSLDVDDASGLDDIGIDISGSDLDGLPIDVNINLGTLDIETTDLPDEIRIMHVPDKTSYKDGEAIDLEGLVVQAYRDGDVWEDEDGKYVDGYVPAHELIYSPQTSNSDSNVWRKGEYKYSSNSLEWETNYSYENWRFEYKNKSGKWDYIKYKTANITVHHEWIFDGGIMYLIVQGSRIVYFSKFPGSRYTHQITLSFSGSTSSRLSYIAEDCLNSVTYNTYEMLDDSGSLPNQYRDYPFSATSTSVDNGTTAHYHFANYNFCNHLDGLIEKNGDNIALYSQEEWDNLPGSSDPYEKRIPVAFAILYGSDDEVYKNCKVSVSWPRPHDSQLLTASFDITVEENDGTAQSNEEPSGGTTISGNYGGSHHSGKF